MNILHVNNVDLIGNRFNGYDMQIALNSKGIVSNQVVMDRMGNDPHTICLTEYRNDSFLQTRIMKCEDQLSLHAMLYPYLFRLMEMPVFKQADIVHYHLLHNYFGSLPILPHIIKRKKSVLTIHDPWLFTGHCIYPMHCDRWKVGCGNCPNLNVNFSMQKDQTALQWAIKKESLSKVHMDLIVASKYMMDFVRESPITKDFVNVHLIPFGIDIELFSDNRNKKEIRRRLAIPEKNFALCFRADPGPFKGFKCIEQMLQRLSVEKPVTLIAVGNPGMLSAYRNKFQILDLGWVTDNAIMADLYCASDLFLMPSTAEAFGLMAIEAMASGRPVVVCEDTSLPDITFAPECGISIPQNDSGSMCRVVTRLINNPEECQKRGKIGRELAQKNYDFKDYIKRHIDLYECMLNRNIL